MNYQDALKLKREKQYLIGGVDSKGFVIEDIIIVPTDENSRNEFFLSYLMGYNADNAIKPYVMCDVMVWAIDLKHLKQANVLFYSVLSNDENSK